MQNTTLIMDFDSTLVTREALDELATISLRENPKKEAILRQIKKITQLGMEGKLSFDQSLAQRLALFSFQQKDIEGLVTLLQEKITQSVLRNEAFFKKNQDHIYIISGGFKEYIIPIAEKLGVPADHVLANEFVFDDKGNVKGFQHSNPLSQKGGKVKAVQSLRFPGNIIVVGDGYTDYEIKKFGAATLFYAFTENVRRENVIRLADAQFSNFDQVVSMVETQLPSANSLDIMEEAA